MRHYADREMKPSISLQWQTPVLNTEKKKKKNSSFELPTQPNFLFISFPTHSKGPWPLYLIVVAKKKRTMKSKGHLPLSKTENQNERASKRYCSNISYPMNPFQEFNCSFLWAHSAVTTNLQCLLQPPFSQIRCGPI